MRTAPTPEMQLIEEEFLSSIEGAANLSTSAIRLNGTWHEPQRESASCIILSVCFDSKW